ncbi:MAG TPA: ATP-binding protein [Planctomycetota bacterium]|nr:ATP-binding protein [Planctomycetota bacterium]
MLANLFDSSYFNLRAQLGVWSLGSLWINDLASILIGLAFLAIPTVIARALRRQRKAPFPWVFWIFAAFMFSCGLSHFADAATSFVPVDPLAVLIKILTAVLSWVTVFTIGPLVPRALAFRTPEDFEEQLSQRNEVEANLEALNEMLETRVAERTRAIDEQMVQLARSNDELKRQVEKRERFEKAARLSEERTRAVIDAAVDAIVTMDEEGIVEAVNPATERIFGFAAAEVIGQNIQMLVPTGFNSAHNEYLLGSMGDGGQRVIDTGREAQGLRKDGTVFPLHISIGELKIDERRLFTGIARDITALKHSEGQISRHARELARSNQDLEKFAYAASHDLQEPLRKVQTFGDRLKAKFKSKLGAEGLDCLERMESAVQRMQSLIDGLLGFARVATKGNPFARVDLSVIATEVVSDLEVSIEQTRGKVEVGELPTIEADPVQMRQLFQNLIGNALKFHPPDVPPVVKVAMEDEESRRGMNGKTVTIIVSDNGVGFDEKYADRLFMMFQRLHSRQDYPGTGMGLAICRKIVERHGGTITARSAPGEGATFIMKLPVKSQKF